MIEMPELTNDAGQEKHVPVITETNDGIMVHVGSIDHPMEDIHYIEWIEIIVDGKIYREYLAPHQAPEVFFPIK
jgi:superoxide reductase